MKRTYNTGIDTNKITLSVKVGTVGTAFTAVYLSRSGGQWSQIGQSNEDSGNIEEKNVGNASHVRNCYLVIRTVIDMSHIDASLWENQKDQLVIRYHLKGGFSGNQVYNQDVDDITTTPQGKIIVVTKPIELL